MKNPGTAQTWRRSARALALAVAAGIPCIALAPSQDGGSEPTLEETRITMGKWIETQQLIGRERNDWNQSREILRGRIELVGKEVATLGESIKESEKAVAESARKMDELPEAARRYVTALEEVAGAPIVLLSVGPERTQTIERAWRPLRRGGR